MPARRGLRHSHDDNPAHDLFDRVALPCVYGVGVGLPHALLLFLFLAGIWQTKIAGRNDLFLAGGGKAALAFTLVAVTIDRLKTPTRSETWRYAGLALAVDVVVSTLLWIGAIVLPIHWTLRAIMFLTGLALTPAAWLTATHLSRVRSVVRGPDW